VKLLKINFKSYVPKNCGYIDEGWANDSIYCTNKNLYPTEIRDLLKVHINSTFGIAKFKDIETKIIEVLTPTFYHNIYTKGEILNYTKFNGKKCSARSWLYRNDLWEKESK